MNRNPCIAKATGIDKTREKYTHRVGSIAASATAATTRTTAHAYVTKNGSGYVEILRDGAIIHEFKIEAEEAKG